MSKPEKPVECVCGGEPEIVGSEYEHDEPIRHLVHCPQCRRQSASWNYDMPRLKGYAVLRDTLRGIRTVVTESFQETNEE